MTDISKKAIRRRVMHLSGGKGIQATAALCGVGVSTMYNEENKHISLTTLCKLCDGLGCTPNDLLGYGEE